MARIYISIGSNIDAARNVRRAVAALRADFGPLALSPVYESEAVGFAGNNFLNLVAGADTARPVREVAARLHAIEDAQGRDRSGPRFSSRVIDLDLLLYDDLVLDTPALVLPREEILDNAFVLRPLADLAPDLVHPVARRTMAELWAEFDQSTQALWPVALHLSQDAR